MITASAADAHRFGRVRRNGYDPAEVDAVVARLVEALAVREKEIARLEQRLAEADASADAIRRTFIAAERTRDEILEGANVEAAEVRERAQHESGEMIAAAEARVTELGESSDRLDVDIARRRAHLLALAHQDAERVRTNAERAAAERAAEAFDAADGIMAAAHADAAEHSREAALRARANSIATSWMRREALIAAESIIAEARDRSSRIVAEAERDREEAEERSMRLRAAIASLEASARAIAESSHGSPEVIDLRDGEATRGREAVAVPPDEIGLAPAAPVETVRARSSGPLTVAEATAELAREDDPDGSDSPSGGRTVYQRTSGVPLSERVKIARKSG